MVRTARPAVLSRARARVMALALTVVGVLVASGPAGAETNTWVDGVGTATSELDPFGMADVTRVSVSLDASAISVTIAYVGAPVTGLTMEVDTDGDLVADHAIILDEGGWWVRSADWRPDCTTAGWAASGSLGATLPASCLGSPSRIHYRLVTIGACTRPQRCDESLPYENFAAWYPALSAGPDQSPAAARTLVYRLWSPAYGNAHFYTAREEEAFTAAYRSPSTSASPWRFEGVAFAALVSENGGCAEGTPVFRFWSPRFSSHFYTASVAEKDHIVAADRNWTYEGVAYCAFATRTASTSPLYRFWSPRYGKHFYTADQAEADHLRTADPAWQYEDVAYYVLPGA